MDRIRWSEKAVTFRNLVDNSAIQKPALGKSCLRMCSSSHRTYSSSSNRNESDCRRRENQWRIHHGITM
jgi:hypothetical protein